MGETETASDARAVANYMLDAARDAAVPLTNLSVQKLVFFAHGVCLAALSEPLVRNSFEAWDHGPVVPALYDAFKTSRAAPIRSRALWYDWDTDQHIEVPSDLDWRRAAVVDSTLAVYGHLSGLALSDLTHQAGTPWHVVRYPARGALFLNNRIPDELIAHFFRTTTQTIHRLALETADKSLKN